MTTACNIRSGLESAPSAIGRITLDAKPAGERRTGNLYAPFERAGAGDGRSAYRASPRPYNYYWVPQQYPYNEWVPGRFADDGYWIDGHYEPRFYGSGYWQPYWVDGTSYDC